MTASATRGGLDLRSLAKSLPPVTLLSGRTVQPKALDAFGYEILRTLQARERTGELDADALPLVRDLVERILPDATKEELDALEIEMQLSVIALAAGAVDALLGAIAELEAARDAAEGKAPAGSGAAEPDPAPSASAPCTTSEAS